MKKAPQIHPEIQAFWSSYERLIAMGVLKDRQRDSPPTGGVLIDLAEVHAQAKRRGLPCAPVEGLMARMRTSRYQTLLFSKRIALANGRKLLFHVMASNTPDHPAKQPDAQQEAL